MHPPTNTLRSSSVFTVYTSRPASEMTYATAVRDSTNRYSGFCTKGTANSNYS